MREFKYSGKPCNIQKAIRDKLPLIDYNALNKLFRKKDIKVNGVRADTGYEVIDGDIITVYINEEKISAFSLVYKDDNIIIADKRAGIEVEGEESLEELLSKEYPGIRAVHRIDRNTKGLVIFALNSQSEKELTEAFRARKIDKKYRVAVKGVPNPCEAVIRGYLTKDADKSEVKVFDSKQTGGREIITKYKVIEEYKDASILEVELITGATHQIRAHLAHIGHPVAGDGKYGDNNFNRSKNKRYQELLSYCISFRFDGGGLLGYLNSKVFFSKQSISL